MVTKDIDDDKVTDIIIGVIRLTSVFMTILFIFLKAGNVIDWPWWLIFSPIWLTITLSFLLSIAMLIMIYIESKF